MAVMQSDKVSEPPGSRTIEELFAALESPLLSYALRLLGVSDHRALLPLAALLGGSILTIADTAARTVWAPQQMPVGVLIALLGVPAMLLLLGRRR